MHATQTLDHVIARFTMYGRYARSGEWCASASSVDAIEYLERAHTPPSTSRPTASRTGSTRSPSIVSPSQNTSSAGFPHGAYG